MRFRLAALLTTLAAVPFAFAQDKAPPAKALAKDDRQAQLDQMIQDFVKARREVATEMRAAKSDQERKAAEAKLPKAADFLPRVHGLIAGGQKDDIAAEALAFAVFGLDTKDEKVFTALSENFVKTDRIKRFVQMAVSGAPDAARPVLEKVLAENPSKDLQGTACYALGAIAFEKQGDAKAAKEAEAYFARVEKEFADVKAGRNDLGEMAKGSLFELRHLQVGMKAPPAESKNLKDEKVSLADYQGKVVVLDIWATWCGPCKAMIPHEREMVEKFKDKPFALISVSADDQKKELEEFLAHESMPWTHWWEGPEASLLKTWNIHFFPTIYVIDAKGVIRHKNIRGADLETAVERLVAEAGKK
jgi:thiol-disulfide isomerase/thioredoxin/ribosomal protein L17